MPSSVIGAMLMLGIVVSLAPAVYGVAFALSDELRAYQEQSQMAAWCARNPHSAEPGCPPPPARALPNCPPEWTVKACMESLSNGIPLEERTGTLSNGQGEATA